MFREVTGAPETITGNRVVEEEDFDEAAKCRSVGDYPYCTSVRVQVIKDLWVTGYPVLISFDMTKPTMVQPIISSIPRVTENCSGKAVHKSVFMVISANRPKAGAIRARDR